MRHERFIPRWLCWALGHQPVTWRCLEWDDYRCGCGAHVCTGLFFFASGCAYSRWTRFCSGLIERLP